MQRFENIINTDEYLYGILTVAEGKDGPKTIELYEKLIAFKRLSSDGGGGGEKRVLELIQDEQVDKNARLLNGLCKDEQKGFPLFGYAVDYAPATIVKAMLEHPETDVNATGDSGCSALASFILCPQFRSDRDRLNGGRSITCGSPQDPAMEVANLLFLSPRIDTGATVPLNPWQSMPMVSLLQFIQRNAPPLYDRPLKELLQKRKIPSQIALLGPIQDDLRAAAQEVMKQGHLLNLGPESKDLLGPALERGIQQTVEDRRAYYKEELGGSFEEAGAALPASFSSYPDSLGALAQTKMTLALWSEVASAISKEADIGPKTCQCIASIGQKFLEGLDRK